jgi:hypothetical protein
MKYIIILWCVLGSCLGSLHFNLYKGPKYMYGEQVKFKNLFYGDCVGEVTDFKIGHFFLNSYIIYNVFSKCNGKTDVVVKLDVNELELSAQ